MSKYNRNMSTISRADYPRKQSSIENEIESEFEKNLQKNAVQPKQKDQNLFDQINAVVGNKDSKYKNVDAAVEDMKKRSGLTEYLNKLKLEAKKDNNSYTKKADESHAVQVNGNINIDVFKRYPELKSTIDNYITDTNGHLPVAAILEKVKTIHNGKNCEDSDFDDEQLIKYISDTNAAEKNAHPSQDINYNLGKVRGLGSGDIDLANTDAFLGLMPASHKT